MLKLIYTGLLAFIYTVMVFLFSFHCQKKNGAHSSCGDRPSLSHLSPMPGLEPWPTDSVAQTSGGPSWLRRQRLGALAALTLLQIGAAEIDKRARRQAACCKTRSSTGREVGGSGKSAAMLR